MGVILSTYIRPGMILQVARFKRQKRLEVVGDIYEDLEAIQKRNVAFDTWPPRIDISQGTIRSFWWNL